MAALLAATSMASGDFALRDGDRVAFYGDSITQEGRFADVVYPQFVEAYAVTRYPSRDLRFFNLGWPGDSTWGGEGGSSEQRVSRDVGPVKPTMITIMLGMNDAGYVAYDQKIETIFEDWYGKLLGWMKQAAPQARYTLIQTSPYDSIGHDPAKADEFTASMIRLPYNSVFLRFGASVKSRAEREHHGFVDFNRPVIDLLAAAKRNVPSLAPTLLPDGIHPTTPGHLVMATQLLESWNATPLVSDIEVDLASGAVLRSENAKVSKIDKMGWTSLEGALPFPLNTADPSLHFAGKEARVWDRISQERLAVKGLPEAIYRLSIDGKKMADFASSDLATGVNLGAYETPMLHQSLDVLDLVIKRTHMFFLRRHDVEWSLDGVTSTKAAAVALDQLAEEVRKKEIEAAKPKAHHFTLEKVSKPSHPRREAEFQELEPRA